METPYIGNGLNPNAILSDLPRTKGMDGARSVITRPNTRSVYFDTDDDIFYIVQTDINNNKEITRFRFEEAPEPKPEDIFVSKEEFNVMRGELGDVKQSIQELTAAILAANTAQPGSNGNNEKSVSNSKGKYKPNAVAPAAGGANTGDEGNP